MSRLAGALFRLVIVYISQSPRHTNHFKELQASLSQPLHLKSFTPPYILEVPRSPTFGVFLVQEGFSINRKAETLDDLARAGIHCNSHKSYTKDPFSAMPCNLTSCIALQCLITYYKSNYSSRSKFSLHSTTIRCNSS